MSDVVQVTYDAHVSAQAFHESTATIKALCGPMGSGKSTVAIMEWLMLCQQSRIPLRGIVMRESYRQLNDSTRKTYDEWLGAASVYVKQDEAARLTIPNVYGDVLTHELLFRHARREEDATNFLSTEFAFIWLEEPVPAFQMDGRGVIGAGLPEGVFKVAVGRLRQKGAAMVHIILTFNPPSKFHWTHKQFFQRNAEELAAMDMALFRQPARENEKHLRKGYYKQLTAVMDPEMARRFVEGEVVTLYPGRPVFSGFREQVHFRDELQPVPNLPFILMIDFGLTPCALFGQVTHRGQMRIYKELQLFDSGAADLATEIQHVMSTEFGGWKILRAWGDPAGQQRSQADLTTPFQILREHKIPVQPGEQAWHTRFEAVHQRSQRMVDGEPAILIDSNRCPILMEGLLGAYRYPQGGQGEYSTQPLKNKFSHLADALQYGCAGEFSAITGAAVGELPTAQSHHRPATYDPFSEHGPKHGGTSWMAR